MEAVSPYLQSMTHALNHWLAKNITWRNDQQNVPFEGTLLQVAIQSLSDSGWDDGVYYHEILPIPEDYIWKERDVQQLAEQFGIQTQSVINIFVLPDARLGGQRRQCDSGVSGLISGTSMLLTGLFNDAHFPKEHADCLAKMLINMIQQETDKMAPSVLTMMGNEEDRTSNCNMYKILGIPAHSLHPMQIPAWCEAEGPVAISGREIWKGDQHIIGDLHIMGKGHLTIQGNLSLPEGAKIHIHPGGTLMMEGDFRSICKEPWEGIVIIKNGFRSGKLILPNKKHATHSAK